MGLFCEFPLLSQTDVTNMLHPTVVSRSKTSEERLCLYPNVEVVFCYTPRTRVSLYLNKFKTIIIKQLTFIEFNYGIK